MKQCWRLLFVMALVSWCAAQEPANQSAAEPLAGYDPARIELSNCTVKAVAGDGGATAFEVTTEVAEYPNATFPATDGNWDFSAFKGVEALIANTGKESLKIGVRVDNEGSYTQSPWSTEIQTIPAGQTKLIRVVFGQSFGQPAFALDAARVKNIQFYAAQPKAEGVYVIKKVKLYGSTGKVAAPATKAAAAAALPLIDPALSPEENRLAPETDQVTIKRSEGAAGIDVTATPGPDAYPAVRLTPADGTLDLSAYGYVEAKVTNTSDKAMRISLRVDNAGRWQDGPWNVESTLMQPGKSATIRVIFGYSYGRKPGFALKPAAVTGILLFTEKVEQPQTLRIDSLTAAGKAGQKP